MNFAKVITALPLIFIGLIMSIGSVAGFSNSEYSLVADLAGFVFLGLVPLLLGGVLVRSAILSSRKRIIEKKEKMVLDVVQDCKGRVTAADVARSTPLDLRDAQVLLDQMVIWGHCTLDESQGTLIYLFYDTVEQRHAPDALEAEIEALESSQPSEVSSP